MIVKEYLGLQFRMISRLMAASGIHPALGWPAGVVIFLFLSFLLFSRTSAAPWIYPALALVLSSRLNERRRREFLRIIFTGTDWHLVRMTEHFLVVSPFLLFLAFQGEWLPLTLLTAMAPLMAFAGYHAPSARAIPTPFGRFPLEFPSGFRTGWPVWLLALALAIVAVVVDNFNLGLFAIMLLQLWVITFYFSPESEYDVWVFDRTPAGFLVMKCLTAIGCSALLLLPPASLLVIAFPGETGWMALVLATGWLLLTVVVLSKYASFPREISLPWVIIIVFCVTFPPLLLVVIPYVAMRASNRLKTWLQ